MNEGVEVLVVEDSLTQAVQLRHMLEQHGFPAAVARNGREALELARKQKPTVVISDIVMPEMDGYELCRRIKADRELKDVPVLLFTSLSDPAEVMRALQCGADSFATKPYNPQFLLTRVQNVIANRDLTRDGGNGGHTEVSFAGQRYTLAADLRQITGLLLSTYENAVEKNAELIKTRDELRSFNEHLEERVQERTAALTAEIAERRRAEERLAHLNRLYRLLSEANEAILRVHDQKRLFEEVCNIAVQIGQFQMASIALLDQESGTTRVVAHSGSGEPGRKLPSDSTEDRYARAFPLWLERRPLGVLTVQTTEGTVLEKDEILLLDELAADVSFALEAMERERQRQAAEDSLRQSYDKLRRAMTGTVEAMATVVEVRDPYTAGHQRRVSKLASAIAGAMDLPSEQVEAIRMAGTIHDLGKISVPAEILSKPARLSPAEFSIVKAHSQTGHDILSTVEFPWPIAQIVLQHHERVNGSGYPLGIAGEEVLLEARVLAVADVVEAMSSHRPYRPALGVDRALEEISRNRGTFYDPGAVDACLRLFASGGVDFS